MRIDNQDKQDLIQYRLTEAKETQADVELLISNNRLKAAINRIYYSMFYSLLALGVKYEFETSKHNQLIGWFNKSFIFEGLIDFEIWKDYKQSF